jgi:uncharacterized peroxidase-related enzyme
MKTFEIHTPETAPAPADEMLSGLQDMLGFVPNVFAVMAGTPPVLSAFMALNQQFSNTSLTPEEREVVQMTVSVQNGCGYCVAGHTAFARGQGISETVIGAVRNCGPIADPKLQALQAFTQTLTVNSGQIDPGDVQRFLSAGYTPQQMQEVILGVCVKTFSNLTSKLLGIPLDDAFVPHAWDSPSAPPPASAGERAA